MPKKLTNREINRINNTPARRAAMVHGDRARAIKREMAKTPLLSDARGRMETALRKERAKARRAREAHNNFVTAASRGGPSGKADNRGKK